MLPAVARRHVLLTCVAVALPVPFPALAQGTAAPDVLLQAVVLRVGMERLVKLELERRVLQHSRAVLAADKERLRLQRAMEVLGGPIKGLAGRREAQVQRAVLDAGELLQQLGQPVDALVGASEALAARLGFVTTTLSGVATDGERATLIDLLARASASALRLGKFNFAAAAAGLASADVAVSAQQSVGEFRAALASVAAQRLDERGRQDLQLAQNQWLLLSQVLGPSGLAKAPERLAEVATTTDRIAESMLALARRA